MSGCNNFAWRTESRFAWTALAALFLASMAATVLAEPPAEPAAIPAHHRQFVESPFMRLPEPPTVPGPFTPRGSVTLYNRNTLSGNITGNFGYGGCPDGAGTQPDIFVEDVPIPVARLQVNGTATQMISVCQVTVGIYTFVGAAPVDVNLYWASLTSNTTAPDTAVDTPMHLIGTVTIPTAAASSTKIVTIGDGVNPIAGMNAIPLNMTYLQGTGPATFGTFAIGAQIMRPDDANIGGWRITTGPDANGNFFWVYDSDLGPVPAQPDCPVGPETGPFAFGCAPQPCTPAASSFYVIIKGTPIAAVAPIACCLPATAGSVCFVADGTANCAASGGNAIAGQTTCGAATCATITCCNNTTGVCSVIAGQAACPGTQVLQAGATSCTGITCTQLPAPGNDECSAATVGSAYELTIPGNPTRIDQTIVGATPSFGAGASPACTFADTDVWYLFTATAAQSTGQFQIVATPQATSGDYTLQPLSIAVYDGGPGCPGAVGGELVCTDFSNPRVATFQANGSLSYYIRVAYFTPGTTKFNISISQITTIACCNPTNGLCVASTTAVGCTTQPGYTDSQGPGTTCTPTACPRGACCAANGVCSITGQTGCPAASFTLGGTCTPNLCQGACCRPTGFACTINSDGDCTAAGGTYGGGGSACTTQGICPGPPNDQCSAAVALTLGTAVNGTVNSATGTDLTSCSGSTVDVWYTFTPTTTGNYSIKTTPASATDVGTGLAIFTGTCDPTVDTDIDCIPQAAVGGTSELLDTLIAGTPVLIRVGAFAGDTGNFSILVSQPAGLGACCDIGAACLIVAAAADCPAPAVYRGVNTTCAAPATQCPAGSCCFPRSGQCFVTIQTFCTGVTGVWNAGDQACATTNCVAQTPPNDDCSTATVVTSPTFTDNTGTDGAANEGLPISACNDQTAAGAQNSVWYTFTAPAAGVLNIKADNYGTYDMVMGVFTGACGTLTEIGCVDDPEPYDINVNMPVGANVKFMIAQWGLNPGGGWLTVNTTFSLTGQCCISGACTVTTQALCTGTWTSGGTCTVNTCPVATGICCRGATCNAAVTQANCTTTGTLAGAFFQTASSTCTGTTIAGCCHADYNKVNGIEVQDIFDFINDWLAGSIFANTGGNGTSGPLAVQNIFDFINDWLAGCH